ncbi:MAG: hypothetical protein HRT89_21260 [Lentisphaeria bacterium]|nr:hypothetical protein [Lentisphaeria bacterium]NQZ70590.1 hypothetical protein [Lentisphaeria bacterium]
MSTENKDEKTENPDARITLRAFLLGMFFAALFCYITVVRENLENQFSVLSFLFNKPTGTTMTTDTQIAVLPFTLLILSVLFLNPALGLIMRLLTRVSGALPRLFKILNPFSAAELMIIFIMGAVSSGISTYGFGSQIAPIISSLYNPQWNNNQSRWDLYISPYINDQFLVVVDDLQEDAIVYKDRLTEYNEYRAVLNTATSIIKAKQGIAETSKELENISGLPEGKQPAAQEKLTKKLTIHKETLVNSLEYWDKEFAKYNIDEVYKTYPAKVAASKIQFDIIDKTFAAKKKKTIDFIAVYRKKLPDEMQAIPGIIYRPGESWAGYAARYKRWRDGVQALKAIKVAQTELDKAIENKTAVSADFVTSIDNTLKILVPLQAIPAVEKRLSDLESFKIELNFKRNAIEKKKALMNIIMRDSNFEEVKELKRKIKDLNKELADLYADLVKCEVDLKNLRPHEEILIRVKTSIRSLESIKEKSKDPQQLSELKLELDKTVTNFSSFDASTVRYLAGEVPWSVWFRPLINWFVLLIVTYMVLMSFNVLIFRQWCYNEKLVYPLAELPLALVEQSKKGGLPEIFKSPLFWFGVSVPLFVLTWNFFALGWGLKEIPLQIYWKPYITGSFLDHLAVGGWRGAKSAQFHIFFALIGLTFLVPAKISGSLWQFKIACMILLFFLIVFGYGKSGSDFPGDWLLVINFRQGLGGGALIVFSSVVLWKCRQYLLCAFRPKILQSLEKDEQTELKIHSWLFLGSSALMIFLLSWGLGIHIIYSIFIYAFIMIMTVGLVRAVAEGGILGFQCWFSPFHIGKAFGIQKGTMFAPSYFAPIMMFWSILFLDIKTFIAPAMANALKIRSELKMERKRFHLSLWAGILIAVVVAVIVHLILSYHIGADAMQPWFYGGLPKSSFNALATFSKNGLMDEKFISKWILIGMAIMALLLWGRQHIFWLPHPIGMIMLVNPLMHKYWFSIFIGWCIKCFVSKYCDKEAYHKARYFFIGLIIGNIIMCAMGMATLNRGT